MSDSITKEYFVKKFSQLFISFLIIILLSNDAYPQYIMSLENGIQVNENRYEFDVYIRSEKDDIQLTAYQCVFNFNWWSLLLNGGEFTFSYINGTSDLNNLPTKAVGINTADNIMELTFASAPGNDLISVSKKRIGRFRLEKTTSFENKKADPNWNFIGKVSTIITGPAFNNITVPANHLNLLNVIPVELGSFTASNITEGVLLKWETITESNNLGFEIQRSGDEENQNWEVIGFVKGAGNSTVKNNYTYTDKDNTHKKAYYRLKQIDFDLSYSYSNIVEIDPVPVTFEVSQNYPNPFNPSTKIDFYLPEQSLLNITIINSIGETIEKLFNKYYSDGKHTFEWNAESYSSGIYLFIVEATSISNGLSFRSVTKMNLIK